MVYSRLGIPSGAKAHLHFGAFSARLKPCPFKTATRSALSARKPQSARPRPFKTATNPEIP